MVKQWKTENLTLNLLDAAEKNVMSLVYLTEGTEEFQRWRQPNNTAAAGF